MLTCLENLGRDPAVCGMNGNKGAMKRGESCRLPPSLLYRHTAYRFCTITT